MSNTLNTMRTSLILAEARAVHFEGRTPVVNEALAGLRRKLAEYERAEEERRVMAHRLARLEEVTLRVVDNRRRWEKEMGLRGRRRPHVVLMLERALVGD